MEKIKSLLYGAAKLAFGIMILNLSLSLLGSFGDQLRAIIFDPLAFLKKVGSSNGS